MEDSILTSTKKKLNLEADDETFDVDVIDHINGVFTTLRDLGVGPAAGFMIEDDTATWEEYLQDDIDVNSIKTYVFLTVRLLFDPPATSYHLAAMQEQVTELAVRINLRREAKAWPIVL